VYQYRKHSIENISISAANVKTQIFLVTKINTHGGDFRAPRRIIERGHFIYGNETWGKVKERDHCEGYRRKLN
jgi:hypothetical protein